MKNAEALRSAVNNLNVTYGFPNRYRVIASIYKTPGEPRRVALVKAVGALDENVSGWLSPKALLSWIAGWQDGWETARRGICDEV